VNKKRSEVKRIRTESKRWRKIKGGRKITQDTKAEVSWYRVFIINGPITQKLTSLENLSYKLSLTLHDDDRKYIHLKLQDYYYYYYYYYCLYCFSR
jgi:hypothetical protein